MKPRIFFRSHFFLTFRLAFWRSNAGGVLGQSGRGILLLYLFSSCIPEPLEVYNIPTIEPQIVVSTQIIPDRSLVVLLTKTIGALEANGSSDPQQLLEQLAVNDATVIVTGSSSTDTLVFFGNGAYGGIIIPFEDGELYSLHVESESLGIVTSSTRVKPQIRFDDIQAELFFNGFNDTLAQIGYSIKDPSQKNWYMINVQQLKHEDILDNALNPQAFTKLLEDDDFNDQQFSDQFRVYPKDYYTGDTIAISLSNISEEYYRFMKLRIDNRFSFVEFLGEPVNYPSNVEGGRGFFNLYIPDIRFFVLKK